MEGGTWCLWFRTTDSKGKSNLNKLTGIDQEKYLKLYVAEIDWKPILNDLRELSIPPKEKWKRFAFAVMLPTHDKNALKNTDLKGFFTWCYKWQQFNSYDWVTDLEEVYVKDLAINEIRKKCLDLGIIHPLQYNPITRQALNRLIDEADKSDDMTPTIRATANEKFQNLVYSYGGKVVCSVIEKPELSTKIYKLPNWRTGYFFERLIHEVYSEQQLIEIKTHEINKLKNAGSNLIRYLKKEESNVG